MPEVHGSVTFPLYLLIASIANGVFLYKSVQEVKMAEPGSVAQAGSQLVLGCAISELIWVVPCFVQCAVYIFMEKNNHTGNTACDIQGYYSLVSSFCSMLLAPLLSWFTLECLINGSSQNVGYMRWLCVACLFSTIVLGLIPALPGVRHYAGYVSLGEGFCYWDLAADSVAAFIAVLTTSLIGVMFAINGKAVYILGREESASTQKRRTLLALMSSYAITWFLWPLSSFLTLSGQSFPRGLMITGGALGHAQALINPLLYGVFWRRYFLSAYTADAAKVQYIPVQGKGQDDLALGA